TAARPEAQGALAQSSPAQTARPAPASTPKVESPLPPPQGFVNDFAAVIDEPTRAGLEARLRLLRERAKIEIGVVTVETTGERDIFDYSLAVARGWGIGPPAGEEGGGVLLLLSVKDRKWQIQLSRSLEADLPDDVAGEIGGRMKPSLRAGQYGEAVDECVDGLVRRLAERRGFPTDGLVLRAKPEERPKAAGKSKPAPRRSP
ncbi:MAG TPA: TPM domain-containing protein, partial [Pyrinomonadaceae bacterium]